jgi:hypothetical protein
MTAEVNYPEFHHVGGLLSSIQGVDIASTTTIAPDHYMHRVTGTTAIVNITLPFTGFKGTIVLIPTGIFTWTAAGNIGLAGTAVVGKALFMTYHPDQAKWFPSYIA